MENWLTRRGFYGRPLSRWEVDGLKFTETEYAAGVQLPKHSHDQSYFCITIQGSYRESYDRRMQLCTPNTLAFHPAGAAHLARFGKSNARTFNIELLTVMIERLRECRITLDRPLYLRQGSTSWLALKLYAEYKSMDACSALVIEGLFLQIVAETSRNLDGKVGRKPPRWLKDARDFVHDNFSESLSLKTIASTVGIHPVYLATAFHQHYGVTVGDYVRNLRIDFACTQMLRGDQSLSDIAVAAGFCDQSHFSKTFRKFLGMSPSNYLETLRKENLNSEPVY